MYRTISGLDKLDASQPAAFRRTKGRQNQTLYSTRKAIIINDK